MTGTFRNRWAFLGALGLVTVLMAGPSVAQGNKTIKADEAARLMDEICGTSLPTFKAAPEKGAAKGFTQEILEKDTSYRAESETLAALLYVGVGKDGSRYCEIRYRSNENSTGYYRRLESMYDLTSLRTTGQDPQYRNTSAVLKVFQGKVYSGPLWLSVGIEVPK
jgi:hypothetical protein